MTPNAPRSKPMLDPSPSAVNPQSFLTAICVPRNPPPEERDLDRLTVVESSADGSVTLTNITAAEHLYGHSSCVQYMDYHTIDAMAQCRGYELWILPLRDGREIQVAIGQPSYHRGWMVGIPRPDGSHEWFATEDESVGCRLLWGAAIEAMSNKTSAQEPPAVPATPAPTPAGWTWDDIMAAGES